MGEAHGGITEWARDRFLVRWLEKGQKVVNHESLDKAAREVKLLIRQIKLYSEFPVPIELVRDPAPREIPVPAPSSQPFHIENKQEAMGFAIAFNFWELVWYLVEWHAYDVNEKDASGKSPMFYAVWHGNEGIEEYLF